MATTPIEATALYTALNAFYAIACVANGNWPTEGDVPTTLWRDPGRGDYYLQDPTTGNRLVVMQGGNKVEVIDPAGDTLLSEPQG